MGIKLMLPSFYTLGNLLRELWRLGRAQKNAVFFYFSVMTLLPSHANPTQKYKPPGLVQAKNHCIMPYLTHKAIVKL
jgi:hypothetical protein